jgi:hypothetical protein
MSRKRNPLAELNKLARIKPDPLSTQHAIQRVQAALDVPSTARMPSFIQGAKLMSTRNLIAAAAAAVVIFCFTHWMPSGSHGDFAFAQVQEQVTKSKSAQYVETWKSQSNDHSFDELSTKVVKILGNKFKREELSVQTFKWKGVERILDPTTKSVIIYDFDKGESLILFPETREFVRQPTRAKSPHETGLDSPVISVPAGKENDPFAASLTWQLATYEPQTQYDLYSLVYSVPSEKAERLPEKTIDGKRVIGFHTEKNAPVVEEQNVDHHIWQHTWWIDCTTRLPIRLEITHRGGGDFANAIDCTVSDIVFDGPLDPALFSTDPPKGWIELTMKKPTNDDGDAHGDFRRVVSPSN